MIAPSDYTRIARAIEWLDSHASARPSLSDAARASGLSPAHFQRLFTQWAGISPKRFLQARTAETAMRLLRDGRPTLDAAYDAGLSGPSRLHDLMVHSEAVTPGELKTGGAGLVIQYGLYPTPFGEALIAATARGLCYLAFVQGGNRAEPLRELKRRWSVARIERDDDSLAPFARRAFPETVKRGGPLSMHIRGTNFQLRVWNALLQLRPGETTTYATIATSIGEPSAQRAVGSAVGANPISWLIPCHRVLRGDGGLGGYAWGPDRKRAMLVWEGLQKQPKSEKRSEEGREAS
jgi:AraC family transcriptional regulator of adaptative response/methylated-DNA-[protein]-cysteine methyltransferase